MKLNDCEIPHQPKKAGLTNNITVTTQGDCIFTSVTTNKQQTDPSGCPGSCVPSPQPGIARGKANGPGKMEASTVLPQNKPPQSYLSDIY